MKNNDHDQVGRAKTREGDDEPMNSASQERVVHGSIEFRDAVMALLRNGHTAYARPADQAAPVRRIVTDEREINLQSAMYSACPPIPMETYAQAMVRADRAGQDVPPVVVFAA